MATFVAAPSQRSNTGGTQTVEETHDENSVLVATDSPPMDKLGPGVQPLSIHYDPIQVLGETV